MVIHRLFLKGMVFFIEKNLTERIFRDFEAFFLLVDFLVVSKHACKADIRPVTDTFLYTFWR